MRAAGPGNVCPRKIEIVLRAWYSQGKTVFRVVFLLDVLRPRSPDLNLGTTKKENEKLGQYRKHRHRRDTEVHRIVPCTITKHLKRQKRRRRQRKVHRTKELVLVTAWAPALSNELKGKDLDLTRERSVSCFAPRPICWFNYLSN